MNEYLKYNLQSFLTQTKKISLYNPFFLFIFVLFVGVIFYCCCIDSYVLTSTNAQVVCDEECTLVFYTSVFDSHQIEFAKVNQKTYFVNSFALAEPILDENNNAIHKVTLKLKEFQGENNEIVQLKLFKNKEKLINRIFKIVVER